MNLTKNNNGITLIALVITIIVLLILAGVSIAMLTGENGIFTQAQRAKFFTEIQELNERIELSKLDDGSKFGKINDVLDINSSYNNKLEVENGKLVYIDGKFSNTELDWLNELGIEKKNNYYMVMSETTKNEDYSEYNNAGTLEDFRDIVNDGSFSTTYDIAYLIENIDFSEISSGELNDWTPIGTEENKFDKTFDGGKNKIENININSDLSEQGIFLYNNGTIKNLILESGNITATRACGIAFMNEGSIINCANKVGIKASNNSGGIAAQNKGEIVTSYNEGNIEINGITIGGIVGYNNSGIVDSCYNLGTIVNNMFGNTGNTGGITGSNTGEVKNSFNNGKVEAHSDGAAGICGINYKAITNCYNLAEITSETYSAAGIVGFSTLTNDINIINCINSGNIKGKDRVGGITGYVSNSSVIANVDNCKSNCKLEGEEEVGGIIGGINNIDNLKITNCMWHANSEVKFGIGSASSNENASYVENLQLESVINIVNGENKFKVEGENVLLKWQ